MKLKLSTEANKSHISNALEVTYPNRRLWILSKKPSVTEIFEKYPRLLDYDAEMIDFEFKRIDEESSEKFLQKFSVLFAPLLVAYGVTKRPDVTNKLRDLKIMDENLKALVYLQTLLPTNNAAKGSRSKKRARLDFNVPVNTVSTRSEVPDSNLIRIVSENTNLEDYCQKVLTDAQGAPVQPYLLAVTSPEDFTYFVVAEKQMIPLGNRQGVLNAFDILFKTHYVTNVHYASSLKFFYNFMEVYLYDVKRTKPFDSVRALNISLNSQTS